MSRARVSCCVLLGLLCLAPAVIALPPDAPHPNDMVFESIEFQPPEPERFELPNGLVVYCLEDHALPLVNLRVLTRAGAIYERADRAGLAGLTGQVMRSGGTEQRPPDLIDEALEDMASVVEISIGQERATASASALARHLEPTLMLFADILRHPAFREDKLEVARGRAVESLRRQNDNPRAIVAREHLALVYGRHPYGRTPTVKSLEAIDATDLREFHARFFHPNNTIIAVAGAVSPDTLRGLIERHLGDWPRRQVDVPAVPNVPPHPSVRTPSVHHIEMDIPQSALRLGHLGIDRFNEDRYAVSVMNHVLGTGGFTARLIQRLRVEEGIAYAAGSRFTLPRDTGVFYAATQTRSEQTVRALRIIQEEIARMHTGGLRAEEFADARSAILNSDIFRYATPTQIVSQVAALEFDGFPRDQLERRIEAYTTMRIEDANAAAQRYLHPDSLIVLVVGKAADFDTTLSVLGSVNEIELERID